MGKQHNVVVQNHDGGIGVYRMKQWLRENPRYVPEGMDPDKDISHVLRRGLQSGGWRQVEKEDQILVIRPTEEGSFAYADEFLDSYNDNDENLEREVEKASEITFGLERDLQVAIRSNIEQLEGGLRIVDDGKERITEAGRVDITATDLNGNLVVIELKAGKVNPQDIAQILAYMGSISETDNKPVRGILVAGEFHKRVVLASRAIPNLSLKKYSFQFSFGDVG